MLYLLAFGFVIAVCGAIGAYIYAKPLWERAQQFDLTLLDDVGTASVIVDNDGGEISRIYVENRTPVDIEQVPYHFIQALVASFSYACGFGLALILFAGVREKILLARVPRPLQDTSIALVTAGCISLVFMAFRGMV